MFLTFSYSPTKVDTNVDYDLAISPSQDLFIQVLNAYPGGTLIKTFMMFRDRILYTNRDEYDDIVKIYENTYIEKKLKVEKDSTFVGNSTFEGDINAKKTIVSDISVNNIYAADNNVSIGTADNPIKDLYISANSLHIGDANGHSILKYQYLRMVKYNL